MKKCFDCYYLDVCEYRSVDVCEAYEFSLWAWLTNIFRR